MKLTLIVALLACVVAVHSQFVLPPPGLGPAGIPGAPILPPVVPPFLGLPLFRPFFGARRMATLSVGLSFGLLGFGKRDVNDMEDKIALDKVIADSSSTTTKTIAADDSKKVVVVDKKMQTVVEKVDTTVDTPVAAIKKIVTREATSEPETVCALSTEDSQLRCRGIAPTHTFKCAVRAQIAELSAVELRIQDLDIIRKEGETDILRLVGPKTKITAVNPKTKEDIVVSLFSGKQSASLIGFEVLDEACWTQLNALVSDLRPEELRLSLVIVPKA